MRSAPGQCSTAPAVRGRAGSSAREAAGGQTRSAAPTSAPDWHVAGRIAVRGTCDIVCADPGVRRALGRGLCAPSARGGRLAARSAYGPGLEETPFERSVRRAGLAATPRGPAGTPRHPQTERRSTAPPAVAPAHGWGSSFGPACGRAPTSGRAVTSWRSFGLAVRAKTALKVRVGPLRRPSRVLRERCTSGPRRAAVLV